MTFARTSLVATALALAVGCAERPTDVEGAQDEDVPETSTTEPPAVTATTERAADTTTTTTTTPPPDTTTSTTTTAPPPPDTTTTTTTTTAPPPPDTTTTTEPPGLPPVGEPGTATVQSEDFPFGGGTTALLVDVRTGAHPGFSRVVLEFGGGDAPAYRVGYVEPPARQPGSGHAVDVEGGALLELRLEPAAAVDMSGPEFVETYRGPDRVRLPDGPGTEVVFAGDFEAHMVWVVGVDEPLPFAVALFEDPLRLVVDVVHR